MSTFFSQPTYIMVKQNNLLRVVIKKKSFTTTLQMTRSNKCASLVIYLFQYFFFIKLRPSKDIENRIVMYLVVSDNLSQGDRKEDLSV